MLLPFRADESIDEVSFRQQVDFAIEAGAVAVCAPGWLSKLPGACRRS